MAPMTRSVSRATKLLEQNADNSLAPVATNVIPQVLNKKRKRAEEAEPAAKRARPTPKPAARKPAARKPAARKPAARKPAAANKRVATKKRAPKAIPAIPTWVNSEEQAEAFLATRARENAEREARKKKFIQSELEERKLQRPLSLVD
jgi:type II secretory pathway component HofQ